MTKVESAKGSVPRTPPEADERLVIVTPRVLIAEEVEVRPKVVVTVEPRVVIQEDEEDPLRIPQ